MPKPEDAERPISLPKSKAALDLEARQHRAAVEPSLPKERGQEIFAEILQKTPEENGRKPTNSEIWDLIDKANPEIRVQAKKEAEAVAKQFGKMHSPGEIEKFISRNYPDLAGNIKDVSIGILGGAYRVAVVDTQRVIHTLKITPKAIDADRAMQAAERMDKQKSSRARATRQKTEGPDDAGKRNKPRRRL
jgi:hypothetical protein